MNNITPFHYDGNIVRTLYIDGEIWFVAKDVCFVLDILNVSQAMEGLDEDEKGISNIYTLGGEQEMIIISEPGFYSLVLRSRKPQAKPFRRWVTHEVITSIRKTGSYSVTDNIPKLTPSDHAVKIAHNVRDITDTLDDNPRLAQILIDHAVNEILEQKQLPPKLRGVVEIAHDMGYKTTLSSRTTLGKFVKARVGHLAQTEKRLCNGVTAAINCYPDCEEVRNAIADFFS